MSPVTYTGRLHEAKGKTDYRHKELSAASSQSHPASYWAIPQERTQPPLKDFKGDLRLQVARTEAVTLDLDIRVLLITQLHVSTRCASNFMDCQNPSLGPSDPRLQLLKLSARAPQPNSNVFHHGEVCFSLPPARRGQATENQDTSSSG